MLVENQDQAVTILNQHHELIPSVTGIYAYVNQDGGIYIGQALDLRQRYISHQQAHNQKSSSIDYQLKHFPEKFTYRILIYGVDPTILDSLETTFIHRYNAVADGYNKVDLKDTNFNIPDKQIELVKLYQDLRHKYLKLQQKYHDLEESVYKNTYKCYNKSNK